MDNFWGPQAINGTCKNVAQGNDSQRFDCAECEN